MSLAMPEKVSSKSPTIVSGQTIIKSNPYYLTEWHWSVENVQASLVSTLDQRA
jgi:hypothetical protein